MTKTRVITIELLEISKVEELHDRLAFELGFPEYYGRNWDAFHECLLGLRELPEVIEFTNWPDFKSRFPEEAGKMQQCLQDLAIQLKARQ